ncbi:MAG: TlpA disulfide reductase family protein, partial [Chloroflexi bacterium]|nr:TlpA disulfide reductase family protein [Chloroflexota bacterium]
RFDLPVWQALREELHHKNFEIVSVATESKGPDAALPFLRAANPSYPVMLDTQHVVAELYNTKNVPAGIWIDESGRIVRPPEVAYAQRRARPDAEWVIQEKYLNALRDWVDKGDQSIYALSEQDVQQRMALPTKEDAEAMAIFRLGVYLHHQGYAEEAIGYFKQAQALKPDNWNYKRQAWNLGDMQRDYGTNFQEEVQRSGPLYAPLDLPDLTQAPS